MEKSYPGNRCTPERSDEAAAVSIDAAQSLPLFLSDGSEARRRQELVHAAHGRTSAADERARTGRTPLCGRGEADHHWIDGLWRLGVGRGSLCRRSDLVREVDVRHQVA